MNTPYTDGEIQELRAGLADALGRVALADRRIERLLECIRLLLRKKYGPGAEALSEEQLSFFEMEPSASAAEVESEAAQPDADKDLKPKAPAKKPVRAPLPADLPREERIVKCPEDQCHCAQCGARKKVIGYETSERLATKPVEYFVEITKREKLACAKCEEMGVSVAPVPASIIEKGILSDALVVDVVIKKYCEHTPLYRQAVGIERDAGIEVSQATLSSSMMAVGELLKKVCEPIRVGLLSGGYIQADETTVPVQSPRAKGKNHQAYFWEYGRPRGPVIYEFRMGREREGPAKFLAGYAGKLQCDGYSAYDKIGGTDILYFGCWAHARRNFFDASKVDPKDRRSVAIVIKIGKLYEVEQQARDAKLDAGAREAIRAQFSVPLLGQIKEMILEARAHALPKSTLGKACTYALNQWARLERYASAGNGEVEIDNNLAENGMRGIALGRNYAELSVMRSCLAA